MQGLHTCLAPPYALSIPLSFNWSACLSASCWAPSVLLVSSSAVQWGPPILQRDMQQHRENSAPAHTPSRPARSAILTGLGFRAAEQPKVRCRLCLLDLILTVQAACLVQAQPARPEHEGARMDKYEECGWPLFGLQLCM